MEDLIGLATRGCSCGIPSVIRRDILRDILRVISHGVLLTVQHSHAVIPGEALKAEERAIRRQSCNRKRALFPKRM